MCDLIFPSGKNLKNQDKTILRNQIFWFPTTKQFSSSAARPKFLGEVKYFDCKRATVFCLGHRLTKHKTKRYAGNLGGMAALAMPMLFSHNLWINQL